MDSSESQKQRIIRRLKIISGQINGLAKMVQEDKYCVYILTQSLAVKEALSGVDNLILKNHLSTHVVEQMKSGQQRKAIEEVLKIYKLSK